MYVYYYVSLNTHIYIYFNFINIIHIHVTCANYVYDVNVYIYIVNSSLHFCILENKKENSNSISISRRFVYTEKNAWIYFTLKGMVLRALNREDDILKSKDPVTSLDTLLT